MNTKADYLSNDVTETNVTVTDNVALRSDGMFVPVTAATAGLLTGTGLFAHDA